MKKHSTIDYIFQYPYYKLFQYHSLVIREMEARAYRPDEKWKKPEYRGKNCKALSHIEKCELSKPIYAEHDEDYLRLCLDNLKNKGIEL